MHLIWREGARVERSSAIFGIVISSSFIVLLLVFVLLAQVQEVESCGGGGGKGGGGKGGFKKEKFGGGFKKEKFGKKFGKKMKAVKSVGSIHGGYHDQDDYSYEPRVSRPRRHYDHVDDYVEVVQRPPRRARAQPRYVIVPVGRRDEYEYEPVEYVEAPKVRARRVYDEGEPVLRYEPAGPRDVHHERPSLRKELGKALLRAVAS